MMQRLLVTVVMILVVLVGCYREDKAHLPRQSGAARSLDWWSQSRSYPYTKFYARTYMEAFQARKRQLEVRGPQEVHIAGWEPMGPKNIGGRTLTIAVDPHNSSVIYAGSAGGGLWKSTTAGKSSLKSNGQFEFGWQQVPLGFPVVSVSSIAINPQNSDEIYIGTGEVYNQELTMPSIYDRFTRGTYGIGILKSTDGGKSWQKSLDWSQKEMRGVQDIVINPMNPRSVWATTTEGVYVSHNAGKNWKQIRQISMAVDLIINPADTNIILVSHGSYLNANVSGIYRSVDGGLNFAHLTSGLPKDYTGRAALALAPSDPTLIYAYISNAEQGIGLFLSENTGDTWKKVSDRDIPQWQGWYSCDLVVDPRDPAVCYITGIDVYKSANKGTNVSHLSSWEAYRSGKVGILEEEGSVPVYVHADIHKAVIDPSNPDRVYFATDGGIFVTDDGGTTFSGRNGGYQTAQFYANFSSSSSDPYFAIGGLQDNGSAIYDGTFEWIKILGGDGMSTAIHPLNDNIVYGSIYYLYLYRSKDRGMTFNTILPPTALGEETAFNGPFELAPSDPNIIYAARQGLYVSENGGENWQTLSKNIDGKNVVINIAIGPSDPSLLYVCTAPKDGEPAKVLRTSNGTTWQIMEDLPNRIAMDVAIHPLDSRVAYVVFAGYNTKHVFKTADDGQHWTSIDGDLPDIPVNTVLIDPEQPDHIYIGTDIGVYYSLDQGQSWVPFNQGMPETAMAMDLSISPSNRKLRVATHGNGVYQTDLIYQTSSTKPQWVTDATLKLFPNPVQNELNLDLNLGERVYGHVVIYNLAGQPAIAPVSQELIAGQQQVHVPVASLPAGMYTCVLEGKTTAGLAVHLTRKFLKQ